MSLFWFCSVCFVLSCLCRHRLQMMKGERWPAAFRTDGNFTTVLVQSMASTSPAFHQTTVGSPSGITSPSSLMTVVNAYHCSLYVYIGTQGRVTDGGVYAHRDLKQAMDSNLFSVPPAQSLPGNDIDMSFMLLQMRLFCPAHTWWSYILLDISTIGSASTFTDCQQLDILWKMHLAYLAKDGKSSLPLFSQTQRQCPGVLWLRCPHTNTWVLTSTPSPCSPLLW